MELLRAIQERAPETPVKSMDGGVHNLLILCEHHAEPPEVQRIKAFESAVPRSAPQVATGCAARGALRSIDKGAFDHEVAGRGV